MGKNALISMLVTSFIVVNGSAEEWSQFQGPNRNGVWPQPVFTEGAEQAVTLEERWRLPIGSGYSGVVVADGRLYTLTTDGDDDVAVAFDPHTGAELWRSTLAAAYPGESGSRPGPLSTPAVADGTVIALTPRGQLVALEAADGKHRWQHDLNAEFGAVVPLHGIASSPLVVGEQVVVLVGGEKASVAAFAADSGKLLWSEVNGSGSSFGSPIKASIAGLEQIIVPSGELLYAVDPKDGSLLWDFPVGELGLIDRMPLVLPGDRLFLPLYSGGGVMLSIEKGSEQPDEANRESTRLQATELWRTTRLGQSSHAPPIYFDGHLYGFSGSILVCLSADDGAVRWRSRLYDGTLILVDGYLMIMSAGSGKFHVVKASPDAFEEVFSMPLLEVGQHTVTPPSYSDRTVYVRNVQELVALDLGSSESPTPSEAIAAEQSTESHGFREIWRRPLATGFASAGEAGLAVQDGRVVTLIADGEIEQAIAVDTADGSELWRTPLDASRPEVATSPGSTPTFAADRVFVISSDCRLRALDASDGSVVWHRDLVEDYGPNQLGRGCQTKPLAIADRLVVQTGSSEGSRVVAVRQRDGTEVWASEGLAPTSYSSPVATTLDGVPQVLVHGYVSRDEQPRSLLYSLDQADGSPLWSFEGEKYFSWLLPVVIEQQVLLPTWRQTYLLAPPEAVSDADAVPTAKEVWRQRTFDSAVYANGSLFAYLDDDLAAIDVATGEVRWRENTFFGSLSVIGDQLAVISFKTGVLRLVDASPETYVERARLEIFNPGAVNYVWPVLADGKIIVRNREEMVAVTSESLSLEQSRSTSDGSNSE